MKLERLLMWLALLALFARLSVSAGTVINQPRFGYSVALPSDWEQIPRPAVENYSRGISAATNGKFGQGYDNGFQRSQPTANGSIILTFWSK